MKVRSHDGTNERRVLASMVFDDAVCRAVASRWNGRLFESNHANVVAGFCCEHYRKYGEAPGRAIIGAFEEWAEEADKATITLVDRFLAELEEPTETNTKVSVDRASRLLERIAAKRLAEEIMADPGRCTELMAKHERVGFSSTEHVAALQTPVDSVFESIEDRTLFSFGGTLSDLDEFFRGMLERDTLLGFIAPEKGAKCVAAGTEIPLADGRVVPIEDLVSGDSPMSLDPSTNRVVPARMSKFWKSGRKMVYEVVTKTGRRIKTTKDHKFLTPNGWQPLSKVNVGSFVGAANQIKKRKPLMRQSFTDLEGTNSYSKWVDSDLLWDEVLEINKVGLEDTYDVEVESTHNFVADDFVVHNSWWLMEMACRAAECRRRVAYFVVGDMSRDQVLERIYSRMTRKPSEGVVYAKIPTKIVLGEEGRTRTISEERKIRAYDMADVRKAMERLQRSKFRSESEFLRLVTYHAGTAGVADIEDILDDWSRSDDWVPTVIVIDYSDELLPPSGFVMGSREAIGMTWRELRRLSQRTHTLLITATQADAQARAQKFLTRMNFAESKQKDAHVNGMVAINETQEEADYGLQRLHWLFRRKGKTESNKFLTIAGCRDVGRIAIRSAFKIKHDDEEEDEDE